MMAFVKGGFSPQKSEQSPSTTLGPHLRLKGGEDGIRVHVS